MLNIVHFIKAKNCISPTVTTDCIMCKSEKMWKQYITLCAHVEQDDFAESTVFYLCIAWSYMIFYYLFVYFSQRKNYLLVGTANGILTVYEDSVLKVNIKYKIKDPVFFVCIFFPFLIAVILSSSCFSPSAGEWTASQNCQRRKRQHSCSVPEPVGTSTGQQVRVGWLRD